jgi:hypothetical protein
MKAIAAIVLALSVMGSLRVADPVIDVAEFVVGFFDAMGVDVTVSDITGCIKNAESIYNELLNVINEFQNLDFKNFVKVIGAIEDIIQIVQDILGDIQTCSAIPADAQSIITKIMNFDISKRTFVIISHFGKIVADINSLITIVQINPIDTYKLGYTIGDILDIVIIADSVSEDVDQIVDEFVKGFFEGCGVEIDIKVIDACLDDADEIYKDIVNLVNDIKGLDFKNLSVLMKVITDIISFVKDFLATIQPCSSSIPEIGKLVEKLKNFDITKRISVIIMNFGTLVKDVMAIPSDYANAKYQNLGKDIGSIIYIIVLE